MLILLDTHVLLWTLLSPARLTGTQRTLIADRSNDVMFSAASIWEIAIKSALRRQDFAFDPAVIADAADRTGLRSLPIGVAAAVMVSHLPPFTRDPFDRVLVAQAKTEGACLLTNDAALISYSGLASVLLDRAP